MYVFHWSPVAAALLLLQRRGGAACRLPACAVRDSSSSRAGQHVQGDEGDRTPSNPLGQAIIAAAIGLTAYVVLRCQGAFVQHGSY